MVGGRLFRPVKHERQQCFTTQNGVVHSRMRISWESSRVLKPDSKDWKNSQLLQTRNKFVTYLLSWCGIVERLYHTGIQSFLGTSESLVFNRNWKLLLEAGFGCLSFPIGAVGRKTRVCSWGYMYEKTKIKQKMMGQVKNVKTNKKTCS